MWRRILTWLASLLLIVAVSTPPAYGQQKAPMRFEYGKEAEEAKERGPPALQYTVAALSTILVLLILCMPSRKRVVQ